MYLDLLSADQSPFFEERSLTPRRPPLIIQRGLNFYAAAKRLIDHAISFGEFGQAGHLFRGRIRLELKMKPDLCKSDRSLLRNAQRSAEVKITFGFDDPALNFNPGSQ